MGCRQEGGIKIREGTLSLHGTAGLICRAVPVSLQSIFKMR